MCGTFRIFAFAFGCALCGLAACSKRLTTEKPAGIAPSGNAPAALPTPTAAASLPPGSGSHVSPPSAPASAAAEKDGLPDPKSTVSGTIVVSTSRKKDVNKGDTMFIIVRRAGGASGPGAMLAVQKHQLDELPMKFSLSGRDAMISGVPFEGEVSIWVRVDKDGDALTRKKGDVLGQTNGVKVGTQDVVITLDTIQTEDITLGAGGNMGGGAPAGHPAPRPSGLPPGHP